MKEARHCVKCGSAEIITIPGQVGAFGAGNNIPAGATTFSSVTVTRYLCVPCGYSEEWVESAADRQRLAQKYAA